MRGTKPFFSRIPGFKRNLLPSLLIGAVLAALLFGSCATAPEGVGPGEWVDLLPEGTDVIVKAEVSRTGPLAESLLALFLPGDEQAKNRNILAERTETIYAGIEMNPLGPPRLNAVALGRYPKSAVRGGLKRDPRWVRTKYTVDWWSNLDTGMELSIPEPGLILVSRGGITGMIDASLKGPGEDRLIREVEEELEVSDLLAYIPDPGAILAEKLPLDPKKFPLRSMWFTALRIEGEFRIYGVFATSDEKIARKLSAVAKLLIVGWMRTNGLLDIASLRENLKVGADGPYVRISGLYLDDEEMLRLILGLTSGGVRREEETS
jgi:hypothetical protein